MRWSKAFIPTLKEDPADAETISHKLMIRAGLTRKLAAGTYSYLPLGQRVLNKVIQIVREEMDRTGAQEVLMPALQPTELWKESGRLAAFGQIIYKFPDRTGKLNLLGPTHEEIITDIVRNVISSYRQLPINLYQIQTKFRDEIRPRFGVIRSKEFIMKDAYSFDIDTTGLDKSYQAMYDAYCRIFDRCGLKYRIVEAESGLMGGDVSHEFMSPSPSGEDLFVNCPKCGYAANLTMASAHASSQEEQTVSEQSLKEVKTPGHSSVEAVCKFLKVKSVQLVKTLIYLVAAEGEPRQPPKASLVPKGGRRDDKPVAVLVRGDHELNLTKLSKVLGIENITMADAATIEKATGGPMGYSGPVGLKKIRIIADQAIKGLKNFVTGANEADTHLLNVNFDRDFSIDQMADIRMVVDGDLCLSCQTPLEISHAIEIGHVFKLGTRYSKKMSADFLDEHDHSQPIVMGCYGIGINRIIASVIENSSDKNGIIWPKNIAPYHVLITSINPKNEKISRISQTLYDELTRQNIEALWDDRNLSAGIKFKDADLIGIPLRITVGSNTLENQVVDIKLRLETTQKSVPIDQFLNETIQLLNTLK